jgi:hypothetical protein
MFKSILLVFVLSLSVSATTAQSGLYLRTQWFGSQLNVSWLFFNQAKKIVVRNPIYGVNPLQLEKELADNKQNVATYTISGGKVNLEWSDGKKQVVNIEYKNGEMSAFDGGICSKAKPFTFKYFSDKTYSGTAIYGSVGRSLTFFFSKTGTFQNQRFGSISGSGNVSGSTSSSSEDNGTYVLNGNTIIFKYANGKEWRVIAQPFDLGQEEILINDQLFKLKQ